MTGVTLFLGPLTAPPVLLGLLVLVLLVVLLGRLVAGLAWKLLLLVFAAALALWVLRTAEAVLFVRPG